GRRVLHVEVCDVYLNVGRQIGQTNPDGDGNRIHIAMIGNNELIGALSSATDILLSNVVKCPLQATDQVYRNERCSISINGERNRHGNIGRIVTVRNDDVAGGRRKAAQVESSEEGEGILTCEVYSRNSLLVRGGEANTLHRIGVAVHQSDSHLA